MALCQCEIRRKSFAPGEKGARPQSGEGLGAGAVVLLCRAGAAWEAPAARLGRAGGLRESPEGFRRSRSGEQVQDSVLVHLDRHRAVERVGCGISRLPSVAAGQDSLPGSAYPRARASRCAQTRVCASLGAAWVSACLRLGLRADGEDGGLALTTQQHPARPRRWLCAGTGPVRCELPQRHPSLGCAGDLALLPTLGADKRTGLGMKKSGKKKKTGGTAYLLHRYNFNFQKTQ